MSSLKDYLYHYTTPEGMIGIVKGAEIWATNIFFLNDSNEWYHGIESFEKELEARAADKTAHPILKICRKILRIAARGESRGLNPKRNLPLYICSFSEDGNLLSQWRAYCPKGGFAIGFPKRKLESVAKNEGFTLESCLYLDKVKKQKINKILDLMIKRAPLGKKPMYDDSMALEKEYSPIVEEFIWDIFRIVVMLKHNGFNEESEWRFAPTLRDTPDKLEFRARDGLIVPYRVVSLDDPDLWKDVHIIVGPSPHIAESEHVIRNLLWYKRQVMTTRITPSKIPYRSI